MTTKIDDLADLIENDFLVGTRIIQEDTSSIVAPVAKMTGMEPKEVSEKIADLEMDDVLDLIDAVSNDDEAKVLMMMNFGAEVKEDDDDDDGEQLDVEDHADEEDEETELAPNSQHGLITQDAALEEAISVGQEVKIGKHDGVVKVADGPGNTAGVLINGEMKMVDKKQVKRVDETVLGMTAMPGLRRMLELAGVPADQADQISNASFVTPGAQPQPQGEDTQAAADAVVAGPVELPAADEAAKAAAEVEAVDAAEEQVEAEVASDEAAENDEAEDCEGDDCEGAERPHEVNAEVDPEAEITQALEVIERNIRDLKVGSFKAINDRIQAIQGSLFETHVINRKRL